MEAVPTLFDGRLFTLLLHSGIEWGLLAYCARLISPATVVQSVASQILLPLTRAKKCLKPYI